MFKNKKGNITVVVMIVGLSLLALLGASLAYFSSMNVRNQEIMTNKQLDELSRGGVFYGISKLKSEIDFNNIYGQYDTLTYDLQSINGRDSEFQVRPEVFMPNTQNMSEEERKIYYANYHATQAIDIYEVGDAEIDLYINNAVNTCFEITWEGNATVQFEVYKVENFEGEETEFKLFPAVVENDGRIGSDPKYCHDGVDTKAIIPANLIYDKNSNTVANGYGLYRVKVTTIDGSPINLQTKGLYNRLTYRTFLINSTGKVGTKVKNNTKAVVKATYDMTDITNTVPTFEILRWYEGDE